MKKRRLSIDLNELQFAYESHSYEMTHYLDKETGDILLVSEDARSLLEEAYANLNDEEITTDKLKDELECMDVQDWMQEMVLIADRVEEGFGTQIVEIPQSSSHEGYRDMEDFIETVEDPALAKLLTVAIDGRGAFRRFKDVLYDYPEEWERWFAFQSARVRQRVLGWLDSEGVEPLG